MVVVVVVVAVVVVAVVVVAVVVVAVVALPVVLAVPYCSRSVVPFLDFLAVAMSTTFFVHGNGCALAA